MAKGRQQRGLPPSFKLDIPKTMMKKPVELGDYLDETISSELSTSKALKDVESHLTSNSGEFEQSAIIWIPLDRIQTKQKQPRRYFDRQKIDELAESFKRNGFRGIINVQPMSNGNYELVAGERRYRAAKIARIEKVSCHVGEYSDEQALEFALVENLLREDLSKLEEVEGLLELLELKYKWDRAQLIKLIQSKGHHRKMTGGNVSPSQEVLDIEQTLKYFGIELETFRTKYLPLLNLPEELSQAHLQGKLGYNHALELAKVKNDNERKALLEKTLSQKLSVRDLKFKVREIKETEEANEIGKTSLLKNQADELYKKLRKSSIWVNPKKQKKLEKLLTDIEKLLEGEE